MSVWNDIRQKSLGRKSRKEEIAMIYPEDNKTTLLETEEYDGNKFTVLTTGDYPFLKLWTNNREMPISVFSGHDSFKLPVDGKEYIIQVIRTPNEGFHYKYAFSKSDDYVAGRHPGKTWTMDEMKSLAKKFLKRISEEENRLFTDVWK